jgi:hypothetical protein
MKLKATSAFEIVNKTPIHDESCNEQQWNVDKTTYGLSPIIWGWFTYSSIRRIQPQCFTWNQSVQFLQNIEVIKVLFRLFMVQEAMYQQSSVKPSKPEFKLEFKQTIIYRNFQAFGSAAIDRQVFSYSWCLPA